MPHTKKQIIDLLQENELSPRHRFGQNFLIDLNLMRLFVDAANLQGNEVVLEVGHGTGSMTDLIAGRSGAVIAVDIDEGLSRVARTALASHRNIEFFCCDILASKSRIQPDIIERIISLQSRFNGPFYLIANLPYSISSPLLIDLLLLNRPPDAMWITIQEEVARRILATPDDGKIYGTLGIILQVAGTPELIRILPPHVFWPQPQVHSAMVQWRRDIESPLTTEALHSLRQTIETLFIHRRKTIGHNLARHPNKETILKHLRTMNILPDRRAETLSPQQFAELAHTGLFES